MSSRRPRPGFSLIEVLVAGAITLIAVTSAVGTLAMAFRFIAERKLRATAEMVAQSHMEMLLTTSALRPLAASDCDPTRYTRDVYGDEDTTAVFTARCTLTPDTPASPERIYSKLTTFVDASVDGRRIETSFVTYVEVPPP